MEDSILLSIKKLVGISADDNEFDLDILININSIFSTLFQIGVGEQGYSITGSQETWKDLFEDREDLISYIKLYTYIKTRIIFDPPTSSFVLDSLNKQAGELEWRINVQAESLNDFEDCDCKDEILPDSVIEDLWNEIMDA